MTLSNCQKCQYLDRSPNHRGDVICAVAPAYASVWNHLKPLDEYTLNCMPIDECREFKLNANLEEKEISLSLTFTAWQTLVRESNHPAIIDALKDVLIELDLSFTVEQWQKIANSNTDPHIRVNLEAQGIKSQGDSWIQIDSSCINSVTYDRETNKLKIRFNRGAIYQYDDVTYNLFLSFLDANSKGNFFNCYIKDILPCQRFHL